MQITARDFFTALTFGIYGFKILCTTRSKKFCSKKQGLMIGKNTEELLAVFWPFFGIFRVKNNQKCRDASHFRVNFICDCVWSFLPALNALFCTIKSHFDQKIWEFWLYSSRNSRKRTFFVSYVKSTELKSPKNLAVTALFLEPKWLGSFLALKSEHQRPKFWGFLRNFPILLGQKYGKIPGKISDQKFPTLAVSLQK